LPDQRNLDAKSKSESLSENPFGGGEEWTSPSALPQTPFPLGRSHGRRYARIEISTPIQFRLLECKKGKLKLSKDKIPGEILNLSEGGVLLLTDSFVPEEGFVLLTIDLNRLVILEGVLGKIKRAESSGEGDFLVGVEFAPKEELEKLSSPEQIEQLPVKVGSFNHKLREIINSYLRTFELAAK
jgi:hypothetical protein